MALNFRHHGRKSWVAIRADRVWGSDGDGFGWCLLAATLASQNEENENTKKDQSSGTYIEEISASTQC
jgi:hypothetical protein